VIIKGIDQGSQKKKRKKRGTVKIPFKKDKKKNKKNTGEEKWLERDDICDIHEKSKT